MLDMRMRCILVLNVLSYVIYSANTELPNSHSARGTISHRYNVAPPILGALLCLYPPLTPESSDDCWRCTMYPLMGPNVRNKYLKNLKKDLPLSLSYPRLLFAKIAVSFG